MVLGGIRAVAFAALLVVSLGGTTAAATVGPITDKGTLKDGGSAYIIEIPDNWNGDLLLYSHGYVPPGEPNPARDAGDPVTPAYLKGQGYALAGSAYTTTGWAVHEALHDQIALLNYFNTTYGTPSHTIAWGHSLGGMITAGLVQRNPNRFAGALPMCGVLAGGVAVWNVSLDGEFVFKTLLAPNSSLQLVHITDPNGNLALAEMILATAQATPQGRARIALVAAMGDLPGWFSPLTPEPAPDDFTTREANQFTWDQQIAFPFVFALRAELEARAGGNPSWNTGVNYRKQLDLSINRDEVKALYAAAGLSLDADLDTLAATPRIGADAAAVRYLTQNIVFNGEIDDVPVLTLHTTGDGLVPNQNEQAYASIVDERSLLRETFVHRAGHCTFTPAETIAAFRALTGRIQHHHWSGLDAAELNAAATALGNGFNVLLTSSGVFPMSPAYTTFKPTKFPRPFSLGDERHER